MSTFASRRIDNSRLRSALTFSVEETAACLEVAPELVYKMTKRGDLPVIRAGRKIRIPARHVRTLLGVPEADETGK